MQIIQRVNAVVHTESLESINFVPLYIIYIVKLLNVDYAFHLCPE